MLLPIIEDVSLKTLNCFAMPMSVIETAPNFSYDYSLQKAISLYAKKISILLKKENSLLVPHCLPFPFWKSLHFRSKVFVNKKNIKKTIIKSLSQKEYVYMGINEQYIPKRGAYKNFFFYHEILVYGYCEQKDMFHTIGYNEDSSYETQLIQSEDLINAYKTNRVKLFSFYTIRLNNNCNLNQINRKMLVLKASLYSHPIKKNYGYKAYEAFCIQLKKDFLKSTIDIRSFRTIYDRALIFSKSDYIKNNLSVNTIELINENLIRSRTLMKNAIKYSLLQNKDLEDLLFYDIRQFANTEKAIIRDIQKCLLLQTKNKSNTIT